MGLIYNDIKDIVDEETKRIHTAVRKTAMQVGKEINHDFTLSIMDFYRAYHPRGGRTGSMYQFARGVGGKNKFYLWKHTALYVCGILVDPSFYEGNPYAKDHGRTDITPAWVFDTAYTRGIHGFTADMVEGHNYEESLDFTGNSPWYPGRNDKSDKFHMTIPGATEPPDAIMEKRFEKYTHDYVQGIFDSYMG